MCIPCVLGCWYPLAFPLRVSHCCVCLSWYPLLCTPICVFWWHVYTLVGFTCMHRLVCKPLCVIQLLISPCCVSSCWYPFTGCPYMHLLVCVSPCWYLVLHIYIYMPMWSLLSCLDPCPRVAMAICMVCLHSACISLPAFLYIYLYIYMKKLWMMSISMLVCASLTIMMLLLFGYDPVGMLFGFPCYVWIRFAIWNSCEIPLQCV